MILTYRLSYCRIIPIIWHYWFHRKVHCPSAKVPLSGLCDGDYLEFCAIGHQTRKLYKAVSKSAYPRLVQAQTLEVYCWLALFSLGRHLIGRMLDELLMSKHQNRVQLSSLILVIWTMVSVSKLNGHKIFDLGAISLSYKLFLEPWFIAFSTFNCSNKNSRKNAVIGKTFPFGVILNVYCFAGLFYFWAFSFFQALVIVKGITSTGNYRNIYHSLFHMYLSNGTS